VSILVVDLDLDIVADQRGHLDRGKGGLAPVRGVEGRQANQSVHPALGRHEAVGVLAVKGEGRRLDARLGALRDLLDLERQASPFGPAGVHTKEHLGPVLGIGPALARMNRHNRVACGMLVREQAGFLELAEDRLGPLNPREELGDELGPVIVVVSLRELGEAADVGDLLREAPELR
jgi:hypothetical protein